MEKNVTTMEELRALRPLTEKVELPGWRPGDTMVFELRLCTLRGLLAKGKIPNALMGAAQKLFDGARSDSKATTDKTVQAMELVVRDSMVHPTLGELEEAGIELTDEQFGLIFAYSQKGVKALEAFRAQQRRADADRDSADMADAAQ